jgi:hypothetical protein
MESVIRMRWELIVVITTIAACAPARNRDGGSGDRNNLTQAQLSATNSETVYQAVERLRPEWLTTRGPTSITNSTPTAPSVFMNGQMLGRPEFLKQLRITDVQSIRFWPAGPAAARFGMGHPRGVIEITR